MSKIDKRINDVTLSYLATINFQNFGSEENKRTEFLNKYKEIYKFFKDNLDKEDI